MNYYNRHIGDYLKDTSHLTLLEHGIYTQNQFDQGQVMKNAFHWQTKEPSVMRPKTDKGYPQLAYYWRKKAGLTGTRQSPDRQWRKREQGATA